MPAAVADFLASHQHVITSGDAERQGVSREVLRRLVKKRLLVRVARGTYVETAALEQLTFPSDKHRLRTRAVLRTRPQAWAASHASAAAVWRLPLLNHSLDRIHVTHTRPVGSARRYDTLTIHTHPGADLFTEQDGIPTVEPNTAVLGTALLTTIPSAVMAADAALHRELVTPASLLAGLERYRRVPGVARARRVVALADGRAESPGETRLRLLLRELGFTVVPQYVITANGRFVARVDLYLPELGVVVEFDGVLKYRATPGDLPGQSSEVVIAERARERDIRKLGYGVGRVVWAELDDLAAVRREIEAAAAQADLDLVARSQRG